MQTEHEYKFFPFTITIDDGFGKYEYKMEFPGDVATYDLIKAIAEKFQVEVPEGTFKN